MTNEEVVKYLKKLLNLCDFTDELDDRIDCEPYYEAVDLAIKALSSWDKYSDELWKKAYARGYNDAKIQIAESGEYERAYWRGYDDSRQHELRTLKESEE